MDITSMTGRFKAQFQDDTAARVYHDPQEVAVEVPTSEMIADCECQGEDGHPSFKLLSYWHRMGALGVDSVAHHA